MAFRYMNPGLASLLDSDCVATQVTGSQYSKTGVAFTQTNSAAGVTLPNLPVGDDFWARFDVYIPNAEGVICCLIPLNYYAGFRFYVSPPSWATVGFFSGTSSATTLKSGTPTELGIKLDAINTVVMHAVYGSQTESSFEFIINDQMFFSANRSIERSSAYASKARLYCNNSNVHFSNVIFSNEEILAKERVVALPVASTFTDMTAGASGIYIANGDNQQLLQSADVSNLVENFGANSAVTGIQVVGNPAYATGTGITILRGLSKSGGVISEHGTCDLTDDTSAVVVDGWGLSGVMLADLQNMQFGWKVGE